MQRMICIPAERYYKMLEAYDQTMEELEQLKKPLKSWQTLQRQRQSNPTTQQKAGY